MKSNLRYFALLLILMLLLNIGGLFLLSEFSPGFSYSDLFSISFTFMVISAAVLLIFFRGTARSEKERAMHSLVAVSSKFLAELVLALIVFRVAKKTGLTYVLLFFVLYLSFSLFSVGVILKTLKKKTL
ncbi:MAG TPA: hypothetical protein VMT63_08655 [Bacteroidales bacterium]|nr:hypothetical protein [Bacteroidales bacterium]